MCCETARLARPIHAVHLPIRGALYAMLLIGTLLLARNVVLRRERNKFRIQQMECEAERNEEVNQMLAELKRGQGILFNEFAKRRDEEEDRMLKMLLRSKPVLKSYCKEHNISEEEAREEVFGGETDIPDSVFTGFNSDVEMDQANKLKRNFNMLNFPTGR